MTVAAFGTPGGIGYLDPFAPKPMPTAPSFAPTQQSTMPQAPQMYTPPPPQAAGASVPDNVYANIRSQIQNGSISPSDALQQLQTQYAPMQPKFGSSIVDQSKLFAPMFVTPSSGGYFALNSDGTLKNEQAHTISNMPTVPTSTGVTSLASPVGLQSNLTTTPVDPSQSQKLPTVPTLSAPTSPASTMPTMPDFSGSVPTSKKQPKVGLLGGILPSV